MGGPADYQENGPAEASDRKDTEHEQSDEFDGSTGSFREEGGDYIDQRRDDEGNRSGLMSLLPVESLAVEAEKQGSESPEEGEAS